MQQTSKFCVFLTAFLFLATTGYGQSLGDVARENRQKQQEKKKDEDKKDASTPHKVITNEDIPEKEDTSTSETEGTPSGDQDDQPGGESSSAVTRSGEQWKAAIQAQKEAIASLQSQIDKLNASIHFVEANRYTNGVQYNQYQLEKQKRVQQAQKQLDEQKKKLEDMQEAARKAGFGSSVYDP
ncbi:MAG TPA: hypothetical protein VMT28_05285 [Terriglobales bacterium]|jgi:hypothetical protein|nr:hypothetical protein [Terriglobales bacterium]